MGCKWGISRARTAIPASSAIWVNTSSAQHHRNITTASNAILGCTGRTMHSPTTSENDQRINRACWRRWTSGIMLLQVFHPLLNFSIKGNFCVLFFFLLAISFDLFVAGKTTSANENAYLMEQQKSQYNRRVYYNHFSSFRMFFSCYDDFLVFLFITYSFYRIFQICSLRKMFFSKFSSAFFM